MNLPLYRKASRHHGLQYLAAIMGAACMAVLLFGFHWLERGASGVIQALIPALLLVGGTWLWAHQANDTRLRRTGEALEKEGMEHDPRPAGAKRSDFFRPFQAVAGGEPFPRGEEGVKWCAVSRQSAGELRLMEYRHVTGWGRSRYEHVLSVVAWMDAGFLAEPNPQQQAAEPQCGVFRLSSWDRYIREQEHLPGSEWEEAGTWGVVRGDVEVARRFLTRQVQQELKRSPVKESWYVGRGFVVCLYPEPLDARNWLLFTRRVLDVLGGGGM